MRGVEWLSLRLVRFVSFWVEGRIFGWVELLFYFHFSLLSERDQVIGHEWVSLKLVRLKSLRVEDLIFW